MPSSRSLAEALASARALEDEYDDFDVEGARRRIEHDLGRTAWRDTGGMGDPPPAATACAGTVPDCPAAGPVQPASVWPPSLHDQAARDLRVLSTLVIRDADASRHMARLDNSRRIDPEGALVFACVLYLADYEDAAQFWWQFAAGAGSSTSAYCLYLLHMRRGELRDAEHWACQVAELDAEPRPVRSPEPGPERHPGPGPAPDSDRAAGIGIRYDISGPPPGGPSEASLREAVERLDIDTDADYGAIPQPDPRLAHRLEELADQSS
ncbi:hypothetical protein LRS74_27495 [Streptomyces sp. LX-29]|uniref:hypothetical protein n=1 Tax=Streptomyces sp. LX-29 TaxID=2900152 RepID=UPI00240D982F|nr:hypothetical protein [Streptomyces sp. LX-29]WFB10365.1 hypothetical protein LRS74_27495 [Streptomyces sp. LX-29]